MRNFIGLNLGKYLLDVINMITECSEAQWALGIIKYPICCQTQSKWLGKCAEVNSHVIHKPMCDCFLVKALDMSAYIY